MKNLKKQILHSFLPPLKWKNANSLSKKISSIFETIITIWLYSVTLWFLYASFTYYEHDTQQLAFYSKIATSTEDIPIDLNRQIQFFEADPLYLDNIKAKVYFVDDRRIFSWILSPVLLINNILDMIHETDTTLNAAAFGSLVIVDNAAYSELTESTLAHELVHVIQNKKFGFFSVTINTPNWVKEGYATYRALQYGRNTNYINTLSYNYKVKAKLVDHAINSMGRTHKELHNGDVNYQEVVDSLCIKETFSLCGGSE
jgi:hypothetical protein